MCLALISVVSFCVPPLPEHLILHTPQCFTCACNYSPLPFVRSFLFWCVSHLGCVLNSGFCLLPNWIYFPFQTRILVLKSTYVLTLITGSHHIILFYVFAFWPFILIYFYFAYISWHKTDKIVINCKSKHYIASKSGYCLMSERKIRMWGGAREVDKSYRIDCVWRWESRMLGTSPGQGRL